MCNDFIRRRRCITRSLRRSGRRKFSARLLSQRPTSLVLDTQLSQRCGIGSETFSDNFDWATVAFQCLLEEAQGSFLVAYLGDVALQDLDLLVDRTPQVMRLTIDVRYAATRVTNISSGASANG